MFVSKNRFIIKTCGGTVLLRCIEPLLYLVKEIAGFDEVLVSKQNSLFHHFVYIINLFFALHCITLLYFTLLYLIIYFCLLFEKEIFSEIFMITILIRSLT